MCCVLAQCGHSHSPGRFTEVCSVRGAAPGRGSLLNGPRPCPHGASVLMARLEHYDRPCCAAQADDLGEVKGQDVRAPGRHWRTGGPAGRRGGPGWVSGGEQQEAGRRHLAKDQLCQ